MQEDFNNKMKEALNSLDGMEQASAKPFFFTRLEEKMQNKKDTWEKISSFVTRPSIAIGCICSVMIINAAVIFSSQKKQTNAAGQNDESATVDEYSQLSSTFYDFLNTNP